MLSLISRLKLVPALCIPPQHSGQCCSRPVAACRRRNKSWRGSKLDAEVWQVLYIAGLTRMRTCPFCHYCCWDINLGYLRSCISALARNQQLFQTLYTHHLIQLLMHPLQDRLLLEAQKLKSVAQDHSAINSTAHGSSQTYTPHIPPWYQYTQLSAIQGLGSE